MPQITVHEGHLPEQIVALDRPDVGLKGFIVIHSTKLGPAAGGCRFWHYDSAAAACADAARLAEGMALKNALAGLPFGGGKSVLMVPDGPFARQPLMEAFGAEIERLGGQYVTAEDVGTSPDDMLQISKGTSYVAGLPPTDGAPGGNPSPWTALGVYESMKVAVGQRLGRDLSQVTVAIQGLGHVGMALAGMLKQAGARLLVTDIRADLVAKATVELGAQTFAASPAALATIKADVLAPCALGSTLTSDGVSNLNVKVVCGAANNQLADAQASAELARQGILFAPDFLVNAGGIINVAGEYLGWTTCEVEDRVRAIAPRLEDVLREAVHRKLPPLAIAEARARALIGSCKLSDAA